MEEMDGKCLRQAKGEHFWSFMIHASFTAILIVE